MQFTFRKIVGVVWLHVFFNSCYCAHHRDGTCDYTHAKLPQPKKIAGLARAKFPLHYSYKEWTGDAFKIQVDTALGVTRFTWANNSDSLASAEGGHVIYGSSYATGRLCPLQSIELHQRPIHRSAEHPNVLAEMHLHHRCSTDELISERMSQDLQVIKGLHNAIRAFNKTATKALQHLQNRTDRHDVAAYKEAKEKEVNAKHKVHDFLSDLETTSKQQKLTASWHKPTLPATLIVVVLLEGPPQDNEEDGATSGKVASSKLKLWQELAFGSDSQGSGQQDHSSRNGYNDFGRFVEGMLGLSVQAAVEEHGEQESFVQGLIDVIYAHRKKQALHKTFKKEAANCVNTDHGAKDISDEGCDEYEKYPGLCGLLDDENFQSPHMCCACGGGALETDVDNKRTLASSGNDEDEPDEEMKSENEEKESDDGASSEHEKKRVDDGASSEHEKKRVDDGASSENEEKETDKSDKALEKNKKLLKEKQRETEKLTQQLVKEKAKNVELMEEMNAQAEKITEHRKKLRDSEAKAEKIRKRMKKQQQELDALVKDRSAAARNVSDALKKAEEDALRDSFHYIDVDKTNNISTGEFLRQDENGDGQVSLDEEVGFIEGGGFGIGERVVCKDDGDSRWNHGVVVSFDPLKVLVDEWGQAFTFDVVRSEASSRKYVSPVVKALKLHDPAASLLQLSSTGLMYKSASTCSVNGSVDIQWFVLPEPLSIDVEALLVFRKASRPMERKQNDPRITALTDLLQDSMEVVTFDNKYLPLPKYSPKEAAFRLSIFAGLLTVGACWSMCSHSFVEDTSSYVFPMLPIVVVIYFGLVIAGFCFLPGPDTSHASDQYGFHVAWQQIFSHWHMFQDWVRILVFGLAVVILAGSTFVGMLLADIYNMREYQGYVTIISTVIFSCSAWYFLWYAKGKGWLSWLPWGDIIVQDPYPMTLLISSVPVVLSALSAAPAILAAGSMVVASFFEALPPAVGVFSYPAVLGVYRLAMLIPFVSMSLNWISHNLPVSYFLLQVIWYGLPMAGCIFTFPYIVLPMWAYLSGRANCIDGFDWEVHLSFALFYVMRSTVWRACAPEYRNALRGPKTLFFHFLSEADMYTDAMFIAIASSCGAWHGYAAFVCYILGVLVVQILLPNFYFGFTSGGKVMQIWTIMLFPSEALTQEDSSGGYGLLRGQDTVPDVDLKNQALFCAVARTVAEDLPQCIIQILFSKDVKRNPMIIASIIISIGSSIFGLGKAVVGKFS